MSGSRRFLTCLPVLFQVGLVCILLRHKCKRKKFHRLCLRYVVTDSTLLFSQCLGTSGNSVQNLWADKPIWLPALPSIK